MGTSNGDLCPWCKGRAAEVEAADYKERLGKAMMLNRTNNGVLLAAREVVDEVGKLVKTTLCGWEREPMPVTLGGAERRITAMHASFAELDTLTARLGEVLNTVHRVRQFRLDAFDNGGGAAATAPSDALGTHPQDTARRPSAEVFNATPPPPPTGDGGAASTTTAYPATITTALSEHLLQVNHAVELLGGFYENPALSPAAAPPSPAPASNKGCVVAVKDGTVTVRYATICGRQATRTLSSDDAGTMLAPFCACPHKRVIKQHSVDVDTSQGLTVRHVPAGYPLDVQVECDCVKEAVVAVADAATSTAEDGIVDPAGDITASPGRTPCDATGTAPQTPLPGYQQQPVAMDDGRGGFTGSTSPSKFAQIRRLAPGAAVDGTPTDDTIKFSTAKSSDDVPMAFEDEEVRRAAANLMFPTQDGRGRDSRGSSPPNGMVDATDTAESCGLSASPMSHTSHNVQFTRSRFATAVSVAQTDSTNATPRREEAGVVDPAHAHPAHTRGAVGADASHSPPPATRAGSRGSGSTPRNASASVSPPPRDVAADLVVDGDRDRDRDRLAASAHLPSTSGGGGGGGLSLDEAHAPTVWRTASQCDALDLTRLFSKDSAYKAGAAWVPMKVMNEQAKAQAAAGRSRGANASRRARNIREGRPLAWKEELRSVHALPAVDRLRAVRIAGHIKDGNGKAALEAVKAMRIREDTALLFTMFGGGQTLLHYLAAKPEMAEHEATELAAVLASPLIRDHQDVSGHAPIHLAVKHGNIPVVEGLLKARANVDLTDVKRRTPLMLASIAREFQTSRGFRALLRLSSPTSVDKRSCAGLTALHYAVAADLPDVAAWLTQMPIQSRSKWELKDPHGRTALDLVMAKQQHCASWAAVMMQWGVPHDALVNLLHPQTLAAALRQLRNRHNHEPFHATFWDAPHCTCFEHRKVRNAMERVAQDVTTPDDAPTYTFKHSAAVSA